jgi:signal transduction histidine kinase/HAMP domain-containing protein
MRLKDTPIRQKLMTIMLLVSGAVLLLTCGVFFVSEFLTFRKATVQQLSTVGEIIAENSSAALAFENQNDATEILSALKAERHVVAAVLYDKEGKIFAKYPADMPDDALPATPEKAGYHFERLSLIGFQPVAQGDRHLGALYLKLDTGAIMRGWLQVFFSLGVVVVVFSLVVAYLLSRNLQQEISQPILALAETAKAISDRRDYSVRATKLGEDELGLLTNAFNQMLSVIQERENALHTANVALRDENTERKRAEEALHKSEAQLQTIVENIDEGVAVSDLDGQLLHFNRAALDLHGFVSLEECRRHLTRFAETFELRGMDGTVWPVDRWPLARILRGEKLRELEVRIRHIPADWQRVFSYGGTLVRDAGGRPLMAVVTMSDVTERKRAEEEIRRLNVELEQRVVERTAELQAANGELEAFSYSVSHDLRAPIRHIAAFAGLVKQRSGEKLDEKGRHYLGQVLDSAKQMGHLIDDLLSFSRMSRAAMQKTDVDLEALVEETLQAQQPETQERNIVWKRSRLPKVRGDTAMLRQVFVNLLANAIKYTRSRDPAEIEIGCQEGNLNELVIFVRDNGVGFDMQYADKLFGVFQRLHRAEEFEGTGIGLANVRRIVARHGGRTWAESAVNRGATFYVALPNQ